MNARQPKGGVSAVEERLIGQTPAVAANKLYVTDAPNGVKLTFAEGFQVGGNTEISTRCAVLLAPEDVQELHWLLTPVVASIEPAPGHS